MYVLHSVIQDNSIAKRYYAADVIELQKTPNDPEYIQLKQNIQEAVGNDDET